MPKVIRDLAVRLRLPPGAKVVGIAAGEDGKPLYPDPLVNGTGGQVVDNAATLRRNELPWSQPSNIGLSHVEGHVAALMRRPGAPARVNLVVSREPCEGRFGCNELLSDMLPAGSTLVVYVRDGGDVRYFNTYHGNGRAVNSGEGV